jgi:hypothetical protein
VRHILRAAKTQPKTQPSYSEDGGDMFL